MVGAAPRGSPTARSALCVGLCGLALELQGDEGLVAHHLGVVAWLEPVGVTGLEVALGAVVRGDVDRATHDVAEVGGLAALRAGDRLDAGRPGPSRFGGEPGDCRVTQVDDAQVGLLRSAPLVRAVHALGLDAGHRKPSISPDLRAPLPLDRLLPTEDNWIRTPFV